MAPRIVRSASMLLGRPVSRTKLEDAAICLVYGNLLCGRL
jgi:hypothetical protein